MNFDILADNKKFNLCWNADLSIDRALPTEIFTSSKYHYVNGKKIVLKGDLIEQSSDEDLVFITYGDRVTNDEEVCVEITAII